MSVTKLHAAKPSDVAQHLVICSPTDKEATSFSLSYPGMMYSCSTLEFDSLYKAESVAHALERCFLAGKQAAKIELREWMKA